MKKTAFLLLVLLFSSCLPDDTFGPGFIGDNLPNQNDIVFQENFGASTTADFIGKIVNEEGEHISGVQVTIGNAVSFTDHNGIFVLNNVSVFEKFAYIKAFKEGYLLGSRTIVPTQDSSNDIQITLLQKNVVATITSGEVSEVIFNDSKITFLGNFIDDNDNPYTGQVEVSVHYLRPNAQSTFGQMPGSLFAQDESNVAVGLETYGMLNINLFTPSGLPLNIAETSPATLEFPVDFEQTTIAPETINLWYFDDEVGYWKEEGTASKVGNKYVTDVTHFSWWNCDLPFDNITACFKLVIENVENNYDVSNNYIRIIRNLNGQVIFSGYTNNEGQECGQFPANEQVTIEVYGDLQCQDSIIHEEVVGPFSEDTSFDISIPFTDGEFSNLIAMVNNCNGDPLTNGYAYISYQNDSTFNGLPIAIENGVLEMGISNCPNTTDVYNIIFYDLDTQQNSGVISFALDSITTDLGIINLCDSTGGTFDGSVVLLTQEEVNNFALLGYSEITGGLSLGDFDVVNDIIDLAALNNLNAVQSLVIFNTQLTHINGFENLEDMSLLRIKKNDQLIQIDGFNALDSDNVLYIDIGDNSGLESLTAFSQIESFNVIRLYDNPILTDISGFSNTNSTSTLEIRNCDALNDLSGFSSLENIDPLSDTGGIIISDNNNLITLNGLENVIFVQESFYLRIGQGTEDDGNIQLSDFCALQNLFANGTYNADNVIIENNAYNPTVQDIIDGNCSQ